MKSGEELLGLESENTSDHERQNVIGKPMGGAPNLEENDAIHKKMMELEPLHLNLKPRESAILGA